MDGTRFDAFTKELSRGYSRRLLLRALVGGVAATLGRRAAEAASCTRAGRACGPGKPGCCNDLTCLNGECARTCTPRCTGKNCGDDGCGGTCGNCAAGQGCCRGKCTDLTTRRDCGACGHRCPPREICVAGTCQSECTPTTCAAQGKNCGTSPDGCGGTLDCGGCDAPQTCGGGGVANVCGGDVQCGGCDAAQCQTCVDGQCVAACDGSEGCCDGTCTLLFTTSNCGACGRVCTTTVANATPACINGACTYFCNPPDFIDCGGVCVDWRNDPDNCGVCGNACKSINGTAACTNGTCQLACDPGFMNCDGNPATGCETNIATNPDHCGYCYQPCGGAQGCVGGTCTRLGCDGTAPCSGQCPQSSNGNCTCGTTMEGNPVCYLHQHGCAGHDCTGDADCTADYGPDATCISGFCSTPDLYCTSDAECGSGAACVNKNDGCGGCDLFTGSTKGICNPICQG